MLPLLAREWSVTAGDAVRTVAASSASAAGPDMAEFARGYASLVEQGAREAFLDTMRGVIGPEGQKVSALDRLYLADQMPFLIVWGDADPIIPVEHGRAAHASSPTAATSRSRAPATGRCSTLPTGSSDELTEFIEETEPFEWSMESVRDRLRRGPEPAPAALPAAAD